MPIKKLMRSLHHHHRKGRRSLELGLKNKWVFSWNDCAEASTGLRYVEMDSVGVLSRRRDEATSIGWTSNLRGHQSRDIMIGWKKRKVYLRCSTSIAISFPERPSSGAASSTASYEGENGEGIIASQLRRRD